MTDDRELLLEAARFSVVRRPIVLADRTLGSWDTIEHPGAVTIIPMVNVDQVCLIENFRHSVNQTLIELPAGTLAAGEDPQDTAVRELREETGYRASGIELLTEFFMSPGILNERMFLYVATELTAGTPNLEPDEQINRLVVEWSDAMAMVHDGRIQDAKTLVGLMLYDRIRNSTSADCL